MLEKLEITVTNQINVFYSCMIVISRNIMRSSRFIDLFKTSIHLLIFVEFFFYWYCLKDINFLNCDSGFFFKLIMSLLFYVFFNFFVHIIYVYYAILMEFSLYNKKFWIFMSILLS